MSNADQEYFNILPINALRQNWSLPWPSTVPVRSTTRTISSESSDWKSCDPWQPENSTMFPFMPTFVASQFLPKEKEKPVTGWVDFTTKRTPFKSNIPKRKSKKNRAKIPIVNVEIIWKDRPDTPESESNKTTKIPPPPPPPITRTNKPMNCRKRLHPQKLIHSGTIVISDDEMVNGQPNRIPLSHEQDDMLERFPSKSNPSTNHGVHVQPSGGGNNSSKSATKRPNCNVHSDDDDDSRYLLSNLDELNLSSKEKEQQSNEDGQRSLFVQELLLSIFSEGADSHLEQDGSPPLHMQRAMPTECPLLASTPNNTTSSGRPLESSSEISEDRGPWVKDGNKSSSNNKEDTGVGHSMSSGNAQSPLAPSLSEACESPQFADVQPTGSRSAPVLTPDSSDRLSSDPERWIYREDDDSKDSDEDKPPSPTPMLNMRIPGRMFGAGARPVRVAGGVGGAAVNDFNRDEVSSSTLTKHIR
uniref:uncharacterized protein LOC100184822 isoform X2 n=1 Tax=Ciona intestinalis TaxID=7719 RepID=UPI0005214509|nr:uncharacterized protein LOC100184822 isoform X2 [Ciona intestinalis]|eukprot:XP_009859383.1 uncharacterized protein LOC100184822 isoform X2 [Ciona intestinalis]